MSIVLNMNFLDSKYSDECIYFTMCVLYLFIFLVSVYTIFCRKNTSIFDFKEWFPVLKYPSSFQIYQKTQKSNGNLKKNWFFILIVFKN